MKVLVTGVKGQLGYEVVRVLNERGDEAIGVDVEEMDITKPEEVSKVLNETKPEAVIHCAAYTAVDKAEDEPELCHKINAIGVKNIATVCKEIDAKMIFISTDYVFDGSGERPWDPSDKTNPLSQYGKDKCEGENFIKEILEKYFIVRISWAFGNGANFVKTMLRLGKERDELTVVADQIGSPTYMADLAELLVDMVKTDKYGIYHASNEGFCSWYDFAVEIFKVAGIDVTVKPVSSDQYVTKAVRPKNSRMSKDKLEANGFNRLPTWQDALRRYIKK